MLVGIIENYILFSLIAIVSSFVINDHNGSVYMLMQSSRSTLGRNHLSNVCVSVCAQSLSNPSSVLSCNQADRSCGFCLAKITYVMAHAIPQLLRLYISEGDALHLAIHCV